MEENKNILKKVFKNKKSRIWTITSIASLSFLTVCSIICMTSLSTLISMVLGGDRAVTKDGTTATSYTLSEGLTKGDKKSSMKQSEDVNLTICKEGIVLLKNKDGALPLKTDTGKKKVSVFGKNSIDMAIAGSGSAGNAASGTVKDIYDSLESAGYEFNPTLRQFYKDDSTTRSANPGMDEGGASTLEIGETPISSYTSKVKQSFHDYKDMAIIFLTRIGGEGFDLPRQRPKDVGKTFLDLYPEEREMISLVKESGFEKIVVVINAANQLNCSELEKDDKIDALLWLGFPGSKGVMALGEILNGNVNPSGHIVDTYVRDFRYIPSFYNFGDNGIKGGDQFIVNGKAKNYFFVDYEEDIYVGYRYFETGSKVKGEDWYQERVLYPFGYGLSYTSFSYKVDDSSLRNHSITKDKFTIQVEVENTGSVEGKDVIQAYMETPYIEGGIEKSAKVLIGFEKTKLLKPKEKQTLKIEVDPYYFASYDAEDKNNNGFKGYELEKGDYTLSISKNAHEDDFTVPMNVVSDIRYEKDPVTGTSVSNHFEDVGEHLQKEDILTREKSKWKDDLSSLTPTEKDRTISDELFNKLKDNNYIDPSNPLLKEENIPKPTFDKQGDMKLENLIDKDYEDEDWEKLLDQASLDEALDMFNDGGFKTKDMFSVTKPKTTDCDGPVGLTNFMGDPTVYDTVKFGCEVLTASTWNLDLAERMGQAVGDEGIMGNVQGDGLPYTGWYAPGLNLHRNPFGGRCCEYYSEDPFLSGKMGAAVIQGANSKGMITYMKHFIANEGETHRDTNGDASYMSEQALRELYLRPFEIAVKEGKAKGMMTSFNRLGNYWTGANYSLCTTVLREEWGFHGAIVTDFNTHFGKGGYMRLRPMLYAGGNLNLTSTPGSISDFFDKNDNSDLTMLRKSTHEVLYAVCNSNAMANEIDHYEMAYWKIILLSADASILIGLTLWGVAILIPLFKKKDEKKI